MATTCTEDGHRLPNKHYNINRKDEGTLDDRGRDGGTNFILRIKEQETPLTLQEHDDDDEKKNHNDEENCVFWVITQRVVVISYRRFGTTKSAVLSYSRRKAETIHNEDLQNFTLYKMSV